MKLIELSKSGDKNKGKYFTMVDDEDYDWLMQWEWYAAKSGKNIYVRRHGIDLNGKTVIIPMHRQILGIVNSKTFGDHRDWDTLNNQRYNLRIATKRQNCCNVGKSKNKSSKYKGVQLNVRVVIRIKANGETARYAYRKWLAQIRVNNKPIYLGIFDIEKDAAIAYDNAAKKYHDGFAYLNFPNAKNSTPFPDVEQNP